MFLRFISTAFAVCGLSLAAVPALAADRGPSTPQERTRALEIVDHFDADPLNPDLKPDIQWLTEWLIEVPDVHVRICMLVDLPKGNAKHSHILFDGMLMEQTRFAVKHHDQRSDAYAQYQAGMQGLLQTYEKVRAANESDRQPLIDGLLHRRESGTLSQYVKERVATTCQGR